MKCPRCSSIDTVVMSVSNGKNGSIYRTRGCNHCAKTWQTEERVLHFHKRVFANG
jgi:transcriptional regulator NrdR family protein